MNQVQLGNEIQDYTDECLIATKPVDEARASDGAVLTVDRDLRIPVEAGKRYILDALLFVNTHSTPDFKFQLLGPAEVLYLMEMFHYNAAGAGESTPAMSITSASISITTATGDHLLMLEGLLEFSASGELRLLWAQDTSNANPTTLKAGSFLSLCPVNP